MQIVGKFYDKHGKLHNGIHKVDSKGRVELVKEMEEITFEEAHNQEELLDKEAIDRFRLDIEETGLLVAVKDEDTVLRYTDGGEINSHKVYYYGKDLELAFMCQDRAFDCLAYIAHQHKEHKDFAYDFVYRYLELRENPEADFEYLIELAESKEMITIMNEI